jgi:precorrin-6Y C5,15-methyltransferase (decarboxylating)
MSAWLHIVGIGEDGLEGLLPAARAVVQSAQVIIGGDRHHHLAGITSAERLSWPSPFDALISTLQGLRGKRVVVLATGDPLWFSVGARIGREIDPCEIIYHPQLSAFQLALRGWGGQWQMWKR